MHYRLKAGEDPFVLNPGLLAIPAYADLTPMQMFYVILAADSAYDNPLKTLPEKQRKEKAAIIAGYGMEADGKRPAKNTRDLIAGKVESVEKAITEYRANQYDEDKANLEATNFQIQEVREFLTKDKNALAGEDTKLYATLLKEAVVLGKGLTDLVEARRRLETIINEKEPVKIEIETFTAADVIGSEDDEETSTIDMFMSKKREANA